MGVLILQIQLKFSEFSRFNQLNINATLLYANEEVLCMIHLATDSTVAPRR